MSSISCAVWTWIMRPLHFASSGTRARIPPAMVASALGLLAPPGVVPPGLGLAQGRHRPGGDLLDGADGVDASEQAFRLVEPGQGRGLFPVDTEPVADRL